MSHISHILFFLAFKDPNHRSLIYFDLKKGCVFLCEHVHSLIENENTIYLIANCEGALCCKSKKIKL
jgi:hypothetical protein